jgi:hypothetical protein
MGWYWKAIMAWAIFDLLFVFAAWLRSAIIDRAAVSTSGSWGVQPMPETLEQFSQNHI